MSDTTAVERIRIRGFRSLADVEIRDLPRVAVLIGANGSGKSNLMRFFEMVNAMLWSRRLAEFVERQGGADDQLFGGSKVSRRLDATLTLRAESGRAEYRFALAHAHPDRFMFVDEAFRFDYGMIGAEPDWHHAGSGHTEAKILETAQSAGPDGHTASDLLVLYRACRRFATDPPGACTCHSESGVWSTPAAVHRPPASLDRRNGAHRLPGPAMR